MLYKVDAPDPTKIITAYRRAVDCAEGVLPAMQVPLILWKHAICDRYELLPNFLTVHSPGLSEIENYIKFEFRSEGAQKVKNNIMKLLDYNNIDYINDHRKNSLKHANKKNPALYLSINNFMQAWWLFFDINKTRGTRFE